MYRKQKDKSMTVTLNHFVFNIERKNLWKQNLAFRQQVQEITSQYSVTDLIGVLV